MNGAENMTSKELTIKQLRFVDEYLIDLNATQAAIKAGYNANSAKETVNNYFYSFAFETLRTGQ